MGWLQMTYFHLRTRLVNDGFFDETNPIFGQYLLLGRNLERFFQHLAFPTNDQVG